MKGRLGYYEPRFIMRSADPISLRITDLWTFRSLKSNKRYIVEVEGFEKEFYGIKFYWKGVEKSKDRYSLLTNDFEPRIIVRSCIEIMLDYYRKNPFVSFGFVAAPDLEKDIKKKHLNLEKGNRRFLFYKRLMINLFGPETFSQISDTENRIYLMLNNQQLSKGLITIKGLEKRLNQLYQGDFSIAY
ncbi:MAG: hypothetical protein J1E82_02180 [Muribaculaceae bacterium]|nr:hypothetical protein [Muribaculaceae bacterium]